MFLHGGSGGVGEDLYSRQEGNGCDPLQPPPRREGVGKWKIDNQRKCTYL
jgi:hypothetical protein